MFCPKCGNQLAGEFLACTVCGHRDLPATPPALSDDPAMRMLMPIGRSIYAIIAGYLGLVSPIFLPAPLAIVFGFLALRDIKKNPELGGKGRAIFGLVMGLIFTLIPCAFILIGLLGSK